jgi:hypothetical protein
MLLYRVVEKDKISSCEMDFRFLMKWNKNDYYSTWLDSA